ncbi:TPA: phage integrase N-terminal domain-containing protein [Pseudomonas aeruginosa]
MATKKPTISFDRDAAIKEFHKLSKQITDLNAKVKELTSLKASLEEELIEHLNMEQLGTVTLKNGMGVKLQDSVVPQAEDWDAFYKWMSRTKNFQMLERRLTVTAYREFREKGKEVPGLRDFTKTKVGLINPPKK